MPYIVLIIILICYKLYRWSVDLRFNNYPSEKVDWSEVGYDKNMNRLSDFEVKKNIINGKYDKKK